MNGEEFFVREDEHGVYCLQGSLTVYQVEKLKDFLQSLLHKRARICMNLTGVTRMDIAALQLLISFKKSLHEEANMSITDISPSVGKILRLTGLSRALLDP